jgi:hypothetical protein
MILRHGIILLSGFYVPTHSVNFISFYAKTLIETACEQPLSFPEAKLSGLLPFRQAFLKIFPYVWPAALVFSNGTSTLIGIDDAALAQSIKVILTASTLRTKPGALGNLLLALATLHKTPCPFKVNRLPCRFSR